MIEAVIFDIDGTIVDSVDLHAKAWQAAFAKFGKEISLQKIRHEIGKGADQLLPALLSKKAIDEYGKELDDYQAELFKKEYLPRVKGFPKVRELFQRIKRDNKRIALASSAKEDEIETYKKITRVSDLIEARPQCLGSRGCGQVQALSGHIRGCSPTVAANKSRQSHRRRRHTL